MMSQTESTHARPVRYVTDADVNKPIYAVWEITLRCDHACSHCGSRAIKARDDELSTQEMLDVAQQLINMECREVTLIGGEAYLRPDVYELTQFLHEGGIRVTMQTGGRGLTEDRIDKLRAAGMAAVGVSVDGPAVVHDLLRNSPGSHKAAMRALRNLNNVGLITTTNMQINRLNWHFLRQHYEDLKEVGVRAWRSQLTVPMGRAADRPEWLLEPWRIIEVIDTLAELQLRAVAEATANGLDPSRAMHIGAGNNVGYYGPHEETLRSHPGQESMYWQGCSAGKFTIGIESDGTVKGCPSLPTAPYSGGKLTDLSLEELWQTEPVAFNRERGTEDLWGFCKGCYYADVCKGGCSWTAHVTLGKRGNNPWCYHRASTLKKQGIRERLIEGVKAPGLPYDFGRLNLQEEPWVDPATEDPLQPSDT